MVEVTKSQYLLLLDIISLNLDETYYDNKLARCLDTSANLKIFRETILLIRENDIFEFKETIGSVRPYIINKEKLSDLIAETDIFKTTHGKFIIGVLGSRYGVWNYKNEI